MQEIRDKSVTVAGLGHFGGGIAVIRWLAEQGARVLVTDRSPPEKLADSIRQLEGLPIDFRLGEHREEDFASADLVVASPAVPPASQYIAAARGAGVPVSTEIRLFIERCPATIIGVTGTKGKSTTTDMLGRMLRARYATWVGGNIGKSLLPALGQIDKSHLVVLELSSFMLDYLRPLRWSPHVAVVTLLARDHLDWHGSADAYIDAKRNIVRFQRPDDFAVVNEECAEALALTRASPGRVIRYGVAGRKPFELALPGRHNQLNAQGAFSAANVLGISWEQAQEALEGFAALPHRLQLVVERGGVRYYDDSIATNPESAIAAMESFAPKTVIQIIGGSDKGLPMTALCAALCERAKAVLCIGAMGPAVADRLSESISQRGAAVYRCGDMATAVGVAKSIAVAGDVVLLSPGYASYDQFQNFEQRGEVFAGIVNSDGK